MLVSLRVKGGTIASTQVGGPLLATPRGTSVVSRSPSALTLEIDDSETGKPDLLAGELPLVWWDRPTRSVHVDFLSVPVPPPFAKDDVVVMWRELLASWLPAVESVGGQGLAPGSGLGFGAELRLEAVPRAHAACRRLLGHWPGLEGTTTIWRPVDMRGGREDLVETDRRAGSRPGVRSGSVAIPDRIARRYGSSPPWRSNRLAVSCQALVSVLRERGLDEDGGNTMVGPIRMVADQALGRPGSVDPPVSSWPAPAQVALGSVLEALIALALERDGAGRVPLSHIWRLYEHWLVLRTVESLRSVLGVGERIEGWGRCVWECHRGMAVIRVYGQPTIGSAPADSASGHPGGLISVLSDLRPDVLVTVDGPAGSEALCIEAKRRIEATSMDASEVAAAAAKYVWGVRSALDPTALLARAIVVSSAPLGSMHDETRGRVSTSYLLPSTGGDDFKELLGHRILGMVSAVDAG